MIVKKKNFLILLAVLFISLLITYSNHFNNGFHFDDTHTIVNNVNIRNIKNIPEFFVNTKMVSSSKDHWGLRPVVTTSLALDYWIAGGLNPFYFHLSTFIIFIGLLILMFFMYKKIILKSIKHPYTEYLLLLIVGWFSLHTVNAETINYIISRSDVISTFFIVLSFCIYIYFPSKRRTYLYVLPAMIGVLAKETIIVLPMVLFVYILFFEKDLSVTDVLKKRNFKTLIKTFFNLIPLILGIVLVQSYTLIKAGSIAGLSNNLSHYIQTQPFVWFHYFISFFLPFNLSGDTDWTIITNFFDDRLIAGYIFLITLVVITIKTSKKKQTRPISFGLIWFMFALLPTSLAPLSEVMNDHRMFFPFIGLVFSITYAIALYLLKFELKIKSSTKSVYFLWFGIFCVLGAYGYGTYQRNKVWLNEETFWYDVTIKSPKNGRGLMNYGLTQMSKGNYAIASEYFNKSLVFYPNYSTLQINLGVLNSAMGNIIKADEHFKRAVSLKPNDDLAYYFYARFLNKNKKVNEAIKNSKNALKINPYNLVNRHLLMQIYYDKKYWGKLKDLSNKTLKIVPNDSLSKKYLNLSKGKKTKLILALEDVKINPTAEKYLNISVLYYMDKKFNQCIKASEKAIELKTNYAEAYNNIGSSYNALGIYEKAIIACQKAVDLKPDFTLAKNNLNYAKEQLRIQKEGK